MKSVIKDIKLAPEGKARIGWVRNYMPLLNALEKEFAAVKPFAGKKITVSVHLEAKPPIWLWSLRRGERMWR